MVRLADVDLISPSALSDRGWREISPAKFFEMIDDSGNVSTVSHFGSVDLTEMIFASVAFIVVINSNITSATHLITSVTRFIFCIFSISKYICVDK